MEKNNTRTRKQHSLQFAHHVVIPSRTVLTQKEVNVGCKGSYVSLLCINDDFCQP